jgi:hypothetical protein
VIGMGGAYLQRTRNSATVRALPVVECPRIDTPRRYNATEGYPNTAFIVQMWWGRPHETLLEDVDENGDLYVREVIPNGPPDPERRTFSCHADNWKISQDVARAFGWQPKGAMLHPFTPRGASPTREAGYEPDGWIRGIHEVDEKDAREWGEALKAALRDLEAGTFDLPTVHSSPLIRDGMTLNEFRQANRGFTPQFLASFAAFLSKGRFRFGWDT